MGQWQNESEVLEKVRSFKLRKATIRPKRRFVPSDNSSQIPKSDNSSQATIRPKRQFVPSDNSFQLLKATICPQFNC